MAIKKVISDWRVCGAALALVLGVCGLAAAVSVPGGPGCVGCGCGCDNCPGHYPCPPNLMNFGYYETIWRSWPCEVRVDQTFPQSVGVESVPTPKGEVPEPLPRGTLAPPAAPGAVPGAPGGLPPTEGLPGMPFQPGGVSPLQPGGAMPGLPFQEALPPLETPPAMPPSGQPAPQSTPMPEPNKGDGTRLRIENESKTAIVAPTPSKRAKAPGTPAGYVEVESEKSEAAEQTAPSLQNPTVSDGPAPLALDGYCPVELTERESWVLGEPQWTVERDGHTYRFSGESQRDRFLADPERYAPACAGRDPVVLAEQGREVAGRTEFCVLCKNRLYMFSAAASLAKFREAPNRYCSKIDGTILR